MSKKRDPWEPWLIAALVLLLFATMAAVVVDWIEATAIG